jgi:hypothetical protein
MKYRENVQGRVELGVLEEEGRKTHEATLINSVKPPNHITSGWMIAKDRFSINFLKPYLPSVRAHERSECAEYVESTWSRKREGAKEGKRRREVKGSLGILVFTSRKLDMWQCLVQLEMSIEIIWVKTFFPPVDLYSCVFYCFD